MGFLTYSLVERAACVMKTKPSQCVVDGLGCALSRLMIPQIAPAFIHHPRSSRAPRGRAPGWAGRTARPTSQRPPRCPSSSPRWGARRVGARCLWGCLLKGCLAVSINAPTLNTQHTCSARPYAPRTHPPPPPGRPDFFDAGMAGWYALMAARNVSGLLCVGLSTARGDCYLQKLSLGSAADSTYEYMLKQWVLSGGTQGVPLAMYKEAMAGMRR